MRALVFILMFSTLSATDKRPWFERDLELNPYFEYLFQHYHSIKKNTESKVLNSNNSFYHAGLYASYSEYAGELEVICADTKARSFGLDHCKITGRYQFLDDNIGDLLSLVVGASFGRATSIAVSDIGSFHHGQNEGELFVSLGKQIICENEWSSRYWATGSYGIADHGSPWAIGNLSWEKNAVCLKYGFFANFLWGFGGKTIHIHHFKGYGPIAHRSIDVGTQLHYHTNSWGFFTLAYAFRPYAKNFPIYSSTGALRWTYPFGL